MMLRNSLATLKKVLACSYRTRNKDLFRLKLITLTFGITPHGNRLSANGMMQSKPGKAVSNIS